MFFSKFPVTFFEVSPTEKVIVTDFIRAIKIDPSLKDDDVYFYTYTAKDGETPEIISHKAYKSTQYHWIIMLLNEKFDPWRDFPQTDSVIVKMAMDKYEDINAIHHYEDSNGNQVDEFHPLKLPVTNIEHERRVNDSKRKIKILKPEVMSEFITQYENLIGI